MHQPLALGLWFLVILFCTGGDCWEHFVQNLIKLIASKPRSKSNTFFRAGRLRAAPSRAARRCAETILISWSFCFVLGATAGSTSSQTRSSSLHLNFLLREILSFTKMASTQFYIEYALAAQAPHAFALHALGDETRKLFVRCLLLLGHF